VKQFLLQMTGEPGSGKSTLARAIGRETGAVVLDKDIVKSRLLDGEPEMRLPGLPEVTAAPLHHAMMFDLARFVLAQGFSVVLDGAAFYPLVRQRGRAAAEASGAQYLIIECYCPDLSILQARIDQKALMSSQYHTASLGGYERPGTAPLTEPHLRLDTRRPFDDYLADALAYVRSGGEQA
jgi:predicted kinase